MKTLAAWLTWRSGLSRERAGQLVRSAKVRTDTRSCWPGSTWRRVGRPDERAVKAPEWAQAEMLDFAEIGTVSRLRRAIRDSAFDGDPDEPLTTRRRGSPWIGSTTGP